jgi:hypothetical protein
MTRGARVPVATIAAGRFATNAVQASAAAATSRSFGAIQVVAPPRVTFPAGVLGNAATKASLPRHAMASVATGATPPPHDSRPRAHVATCR